MPEVLAQRLLEGMPPAPALPWEQAGRVGLQWESGPREEACGPAAAAPRGCRTFPA